MMALPMTIWLLDVGVHHRLYAIERRRLVDEPVDVLHGLHPLHLGLLLEQL